MQKRCCLELTVVCCRQVASRACSEHGFDTAATAPARRLRPQLQAQEKCAGVDWCTHALLSAHFKTRGRAGCQTECHSRHRELWLSERGTLRSNACTLSGSAVAREDEAWRPIRLGLRNKHLGGRGHTSRRRGTWSGCLGWAVATGRGEVIWPGRAVRGGGRKGVSGSFLSLAGQAGARRAAVLGRARGRRPNVAAG